jgi:hypothetical protein
MAISTITAMIMATGMITMESIYVRIHFTAFYAFLLSPPNVNAQQENSQQGLETQYPRTF